MTYTFQVVASQYHRGKIAIIYDPDRNGFVNLTLNPDYNNHITTILDLQDLDNFELAIPWRSAETMLKVPALGTTMGSTYKPNPAGVSLAIPLINPITECNGFFTILVVNELTSAVVPVTPIEINVYARCDNLEVAFPRDIPREALDNGERLVSEGPDDDACDVNGRFDKDEMATRHMIGGEVVNGDLFKVVFGESILSFRTLLKRFTGEYRAEVLTTPAQDVIRLQGPLYPRTQYLSLGSSPGTGVVLTHNCSHYEYLKYAFLAVRGGMRRAVRFTAIDVISDYYNCTNLHGDVFDVIIKTTDLFTDDDFRIMGTVCNPSSQNNGMTFETPMYSSARYSIGLTIRGVAGTSAYQDREMTKYILSASSATAGTPQTHFSTAVAAADDFSMAGFFGSPPRIVGYANI